MNFLQNFREMKSRSEKIAWVTASDFPTSTAAERGGVSYILAGDSSYMTQYGFPDTKSATLEQMIFITQAVKRGAPSTPVCSDFPINTYENPQQALETAKRFTGETNCEICKLEGRKVKETEIIAKNNIKICNHLGLVPQSSNGFKVYGKTKESFEELVESAIDLYNAGASMLLLEAIPEPCARAIALNVPDMLTLGIGAGRHLDGNLIIQNDLLGYYPSFRPTFVKCFIPETLPLLSEKLKNVSYDELQDYGKKNPGSDGFLYLATEANRLYTEAVKAGVYPEPRHNYKIKPEELEILKTSKYWKE